MRTKDEIEAAGGDVEEATPEELERIRQRRKAGREVYDIRVRWADSSVVDYEARAYNYEDGGNVLTVWLLTGETMLVPWANVCEVFVVTKRI